MLFGDVNENGKLDEEDEDLIFDIAMSDLSLCKYTDEWAWYYYSIFGDATGDYFTDVSDSSVLEYYLVKKDDPNEQLSILDYIRPYYGDYWYEDLLNVFHNDIIL